MLAARRSRLDLHDLPVRGESLLKVWQQAVEAAFSCSLGGNVASFGEWQETPLPRTHPVWALQGKVCRVVLWCVWA